MSLKPLPPVFLARVLDDPSIVRDLVTCNGPYWSIQRYFRNATEMEVLRTGGTPSPREQDMFVAPWFRQDWAYDGPLVAGVEPILSSPRFRAAAAQVFGGAEEVRPQIVYVNLFAPIPSFDAGHVDIPAFRGVDRTTVPVWLLALMLRSGLFEAWRIPIATGVSFWYDGPGGGFTCWPEGPDRPAVSRPCRTNTAVVGDNDRMFHRVEAVGPAGTRFMRGLTLDSQLLWTGEAWAVTDGARTLAHLPFEAVRVSISWKAQVLRSREEAEKLDGHEDDLDLERVVETFLADLHAKGHALRAPAEPLADDAFVAALNGAYPQPKPLDPSAA
jgi:hypothetical protein